MTVTVSLDNLKQESVPGYTSNLYSNLPQESSRFGANINNSSTSSSTSTAATTTSSRNTTAVPTQSQPHHIQTPAVGRPKRKTPAPIIPPIASPPSAFERRSSFATTSFLPISPFPHSPSSQPTLTSLTPSPNSSSQSPSPFPPLSSPTIAQSPYSYAYSLNPYGGTSDGVHSLPFASFNVHSFPNNNGFIGNTPFEAMGSMSPSTSLPLAFSQFSASPLYGSHSAQPMNWPIHPLQPLTQSTYPTMSSSATNLPNMISLPPTAPFSFAQSMPYLQPFQPFSSSQTTTMPIAAPLGAPDAKIPSQNTSIQLQSAKESKDGYTFVCNYPNCGDSFKTRFSLKRHTKKHSGVKPFVCHHNGCNKRFAEKSTLKRHLRIHTGEKPYQCSVPGCGKTFADRTNVKRHEMIHSGDRPYWCTVPDCKRGYFWRKHLKKHLYSVHGIGEPVDGKSDPDEEEDAPSDDLDDEKDV